MTTLHPEYLRAYHSTAQDMLAPWQHQMIHETAMRRAGGRVSGQNRATLTPMPASDLGDISRSEDAWSIEAPVLTAFVAKDEDGTPHRLVYSTVYTPYLQDSHGDWCTPADIEKAAHRFLRDVVKQGPTADMQHDRDCVEDVWPVESYIAPSDLVINDRPVRQGAWVICHEFGPSDRAEAIWQGVLNGELLSVSLDGSAVMEDTPCPV